MNSIAEIVSDPEEYLDFNTKDQTVFAVGCEEDDDEITFSTLESNDVEDFKDNLADIENMVKTHSRVDFSKKWQELQE